MTKSDAKAVYVKIDLGLSRPDNRVEYELWYSSILDLSKQAISELGEYQKPFGSNALFTPRIVTFACENCPKYIRESQCISDGKYCPYRAAGHDEMPNPLKFGSLALDFGDSKLHALANVVEDKVLIMEALREKCVYESVVAEDETLVLKKWYNYMSLLSMSAITRGNLTKEIAENIMGVYKIDKLQIETCVNNSFDISGDYQSDNKYLREDRKW